jgi:LytS/YehU family sensor histidine kinase
MFCYQIRDHRGVHDSWFDVVLNAILQVTYLMSVAYSNYLYYLPRFLKHKQWWRFTLEFLVTVVIATWIFLILKRYLIDGYTYQIDFAYSARFAITVAMSAIFIASFIAMLKFLEDWFQLEASRQEMINEKLSAELRFLKAQINPHFLFNTLNNLYALTLKKSDLAPEIVIKLSEMMRYMLYDCNEKRVLLSKEVAYLQNYLDLERLRQGNSVSINFTVEGQISEQKIAPLLFIPFLENSFKHGLNSYITNGGFVNLLLQVDLQTVHFSIENSKPEKVPIADPNRRSGGIGLVNVHRRLNLMYSNNYELKIDNNPKTYIVDLTIELDE